MPTLARRKRLEDDPRHLAVNTGRTLLANAGGGRAEDSKQQPSQKKKHEQTAPGSKIPAKDQATIPIKEESQAKFTLVPCVFTLAW